MSQSNKYITVHGHFYQPPRENAWLDIVELQDTAAPFHDWNERINHECYSTNAVARILDEESYINRITSNYSRISFNFGPTLLSWLEMNDKETYDRIIASDRRSRERFGGHGSALAQVHSHIIMPLANERDKRTQVEWGLADFEQRFGRKAEGIWLAETAVDTDTLEVLADYDIKFTVLAPRQMKALRPDGGEWYTVRDEQFDTRLPYKCILPSGREIALFFYNGDISKGIAFEGLLKDGKAFASRLLHTFDDNNQPQLTHIATDGESYGHHHRYGEMALAACLKTVEESEQATLTNYGQYLEMFPPTYEAQIWDNSSWSCVHGVERWRSDCGCHTGGEGHWNQAWRAPLREALDWLRDELIPLYQREGGKLLHDVWKARNDYIRVLLHRNEQTVGKFIERNAKYDLDADETTQLLRLMEMQRNAVLMYTSCGWFFNEVSGIETNQILQYALRAIEYARQTGGAELQEQFEALLEKTPSNLYANALENWQKNVLPTSVKLERAGTHFAAAALFEDNLRNIELFNYDGISKEVKRAEAGGQRMAIGRMTLRSKITYSEKNFAFAAVYLGQQNIFGTISTKLGDEEFGRMREALLQAFNSANLGEVIILTEKYFGKKRFTIRNLFQDEKRKILQQVMHQNLGHAERHFRDIYEDNYQLMTVMAESNIPIPQVYYDATEHVLNKDLQNYFLQEKMYLRDLERLDAEFKKWKAEIKNVAALKLNAGTRLLAEIQRLPENTEQPERLRVLNKILRILNKMTMVLAFAKVQNAYYRIAKQIRKGELTADNEEWKTAFLELGDILKVRADLD